MIHYWQAATSIRDADRPKYYNPELALLASRMAETHDCITIGSMVRDGTISTDTGHEIGKSAYGTGDIPFVRTSDIANWEIKSAPKQGVSRSIYEEYAADQDIRPGDILFVRDGTYLIGTNCIITAIDKEILYQSHVLKLRVNDQSRLDSHLLFLALNNSWVQSQIRSFQFTADIIDTIGQRFSEISIPVPRDKQVQAALVDGCRAALATRMAGKAFVKHCRKLLKRRFVWGMNRRLPTSLQCLQMRKSRRLQMRPFPLNSVRLRRFGVDPIR